MDRISRTQAVNSLQLVLSTDSGHYQVEDSWFEIILPSLQLVLTDQVPLSHRTKAEFTIKRLGLDRNQQVIAHRVVWFNMYQNGEISFEGLAKKAPLIARATARQNSSDSG